ncbi:MAG TPA: AAA domain-containing protein, partial [Rubricoccaceae bacterium]
MEPDGPPQRYRLTASNLARYFKHGCDRLLRWEAVSGKDREGLRVAEGVPEARRLDSRPGIQLLMAGGDAFEMDRVLELQALYGESDVHLEGVQTKRNGQESPAPTPLRTLGDLLRSGAPPRFVAQPEVDLARDAPEAAARFLRAAGLDPARVELRPSLLDLLEVVAPASLGGPALLRVWDFKASPKAKHEHFAQVAYYSLLLEHVVDHLGLVGRYAVDTEWGVVRSKQDDPEVFELGPYRRAVLNVLRNRVPAILGTPALEAHYHVCPKCLVCEYVETCRREANAVDDLSRIAYVSSESKRRLNEAGIGTCAQLAELDPAGDEADLVRTMGHDLSVHLTRYVAVARALRDGVAESLETTTLAVPAHETVRVVVSAEQDGVTGTTFALGLKTNEGYDDEAGRPVGVEEVFVAGREGPEEEARILGAFLRTLNGLFDRVDAHNKAIAGAPSAAETAYTDACAARDALKAELNAAEREKRARGARSNSKDPELRDLALNAADLRVRWQRARDAAEALVAPLKADRWDRRKRQQTLHLYVYDGLDLAAIKSALERHMGPETDDALRREIVRLVRLFPPDSVLPDAETFRSVPGTVVVDALRRLAALPAPYIYDLKAVSALYRPSKADGSVTGSQYLPRSAFAWPLSNQVAFERIHDVWNERAFSHKVRDPDGNRVLRTYEHAETLAQIETTVRGKLRATDSVVRRLKQDHDAERDREAAERGVDRRDARGTLLLRKGPFRLYTDFDPTDFSDPEALQTFALLEAALSELQTRSLHALKPDERVAKFEAIGGLRYLPGLDEDEKTVHAGKPQERTFAQALWFAFDPASRDAKFVAGQDHLVVTREGEPDTLQKTVDGPLFAEYAGFQGTNFKVKIDAIKLSDPREPRLLLRPHSPERFREVLGLDAAPDGPFVLDSPHSDPLTERLLGALAWLRGTPEAGPPAGASHVAEILATGTVRGWRPVIETPQRPERELRQRMAAANSRAGEERYFLNGEQWDILRGAPQDPLTMVWGPPGTGKTHLAGHLLALYALAANGARPVRVFVTASTHHATVNVLSKLAALADAYGIDPAALHVAKLGTENAADAELPGRVDRVSEDALSGVLAGHPAPCVVVGGTVWSLYKALLDSNKSFLGRPLFDAVLVDEASQMTVPQALIALCAAKPGANVVLAGDDKQLPPIVHGTYPEAHDHLLSSVFALARKRAGDRPGGRRTLFQLTRNFRMNEPLTAHPRASVYGTYESHFPDIRSALTAGPGADELSSFVLHPDRPAVLVRYAPPQSFTASNPVEALIAAGLVAHLAGTLLDPETVEAGAPALYTPERFASHGVAVLAPHRAQNAAIRHALSALGFGDGGRPMPLVDTVEKLQGKEREVVVVSYGVADAEYADAEADFLLSQARFNVAS